MIASAIQFSIDKATLEGVVTTLVIIVVLASVALWVVLKKRK
jgi:hypothetical protein